MTTNSAAVTALAAKLGAAGADTLTLQRPIVPETVGKEIARRFTDVDLVLTPDNIDDAVLGHVVARELGADLVFAWNDEGLLGLTQTTAAGMRTLLLSYDWATYPGLTSIVTLAQSELLDAIGVVSVLSPGPVSDVELPVTLLA